jgi:Fe-S-cluster-containing dehydrogenase component/DMSO reductase anchor subunit
MTRWVMVADLVRCVGCQTCTAACRHANATSPAVQWRKVLDIETGTYPNVSRTFVPVGCQHCADPPCLDVCPSTATRQREDGIVTIDYDLCIGCSYCAVACPYQARFKVDAPRFAYGKSRMQNETIREDKRRLGVAQKCTFCIDRIDAGLAEGLVPGADPLATPACVNACIADALHFGDLDDPSSEVSKLLAERAHFRMHDELATNPGFYYLDNRRGQHNGAGLATAAISLGSRSKGVAPWPQTQWDWRAAANFIFGGAGAGLFVFAALFVVADRPFAMLGSLAVALVALGLFTVWLEIGRPWRMVNVMFHPQRSWMTRESMVAVAFFVLALPSLWFSSAVLAVAAGIFAIAFLYSQARILRSAKGIPAWRLPQIVPLIVSSGLAEGSGLCLAAAALLPLSSAALMYIAGALLVLIVIRQSAWQSYHRCLAAAAAPARTLEIVQVSSWWVMLFGLVAPASLVLAANLIPSLTAPLYVLAGFFACGAGSALKFVLVTRAALNQGFALRSAQVPNGSG